MVLQRNSPDTNVWGWATDPNTLVTIKFNGQQFTTVPNNITGLWKVTLGAMGIGGPYTLTASTNTSNFTTSLSDILVGEVYLCSGQSNMEFSVSSAFNASVEIAAADQYTDKPIRIQTFNGHGAATPQTGGSGTWSHVSHMTIPRFSAVCWFGGRDLFDDLGGDVPVGLISSDVGGTGVEYWSPAAAIAECKQTPPSPSDSTLYNGFIAPFTVGPMALRAVVWYQGESNTCPQSGTRPCGREYYSCQFAAMIRGWRRAFRRPLLPFVFVLLAPDQKANAVADIRMAQLHALRQPNTAVVNAMDDGDCTPSYCAVHVRDKQLIGQRLHEVLIGLLDKQNETTPHWPGLTPLATEWTNTSDCEQRNFTHGVTISFIDVGSGLEVVRDGRQGVCGGHTGLGQPLATSATSISTLQVCNCTFCGYPVPACLCRGLEIQVNASLWIAATAPSVSSDGLRVTVCANYPEGIHHPATGVRYGMSDWPIVTLYSKQGHPAAPFEFPVGAPVGPGPRPAGEARTVL